MGQIPPWMKREIMEEFKYYYNFRENIFFLFLPNNL